jgi:hypothetical protein
MASRGNRIESHDFIVRDEIDELFGEANPNPDRTGCPPQDVLSALARHARPIDDPAYEHLSRCSPCYREFRELQEQAATAPPMPRRTIRRWIAAAVILVLVATGLWFYVTSRNATNEPVQAGRQQPAPAELRATLDLRPYAVSRNPQEPGGPPPLILPRGRIVATILLVVGSEPGPYEVEIRDSAAQALAVASGQAAMRNFVTTLEVTVDLQNVTPGDHRLAVRRAGEDWRVYPLTIR